MPQALPGPTESGWTAESATLAEDDEMSSEVAPSALCICDMTFLLGMVGVETHVCNILNDRNPVNNYLRNFFEFAHIDKLSTLSENAGHD